MAIGSNPAASVVKAGTILSVYDKWMKDYYISNSMKKALLYNRSPMLAYLTKEAAMMKVQGKQIITNVLLGASPNVASTFEKAQASAKSYGGDFASFTIPFDRKFAVERVENLTAYSSMAQLGAFEPAFKEAGDLALYNMGTARGFDVWSDGTGALGSVASVSGTTITLKNASSLTAIKKNMSIQFYQGAGDSKRGAVVRVTGVTQSSKSPKMTISAAVSGLAANDTFFIDGDKGIRRIAGIPAWIPKTAPGSTPFMGTARNQNTEQLAGFRDSMSASETYDKAIRSLAAEVQTFRGKSPDSLWVHPTRFQDLVTELGDKIRYQSTTLGQKYGGSFGFSGIVFHTGQMGGPEMPVMVDNYMDPDCIYGLAKGSWKLHYIAAPGKDFIDFMPNAGMGNGTSVGELLAFDGAAFEIRLESYTALSCHAPGCNFVIDAKNKTIS